MNTKRIFATSLLCAISFTSLSTADAATTRKPKPTAADRRKADLTELHVRASALYVKWNVNKTDVSVVAAEGNTIYTGEAYRGVLAAEQRDLAAGNYYVGTTVESFDFRILSSSTTAAVIRVCERFKSNGAVNKQTGTPAVDPFPLWVTDRQISAVYSPRAKRWLFSRFAFLEPEEGKSKCADGR